MSEAVYDEFKDPYTMIQDLLEYITDCREKKYGDPILDLIFQYCHNHNYDPEIVGDTIRDDYYFSELIKSDCKKNDIIVDRGHSRLESEDW